MRLKILVDNLLEFLIFDSKLSNSAKTAQKVKGILNFSNILYSESINGGLMQAGFNPINLNATLNGMTYNGALNSSASSFGFSPTSNSFPSPGSFNGFSGNFGGYNTPKISRQFSCPADYGVHGSYKQGTSSSQRGAGSVGGFNPLFENASRPNWGLNANAGSSLINPDSIPYSKSTSNTHTNSPNPALYGITQGQQITESELQILIQCVQICVSGRPNFGNFCRFSDLFAKITN